MPGLLIVRGDEQRVPFTDLAFGFCLSKRSGRLLVRPTCEELQQALLDADSFFYYGHGLKDGSLQLGNGEYFTQADLEWVASQRERKLLFAEVRACYSCLKGEYVNRWLEVAEVVHCFPSVTASPVPPFIHPMHTYRSAISYDPGGRGFWSRLGRGPKDGS
jgi:hypothetical protein